MTDPTGTSAEAVERLRLLGDRAAYMPHVYHEAADRIEALAAENAALRAERDRLREALEALRFEVLCIKRNRAGTLGMALDRADAALATPPPEPD